MSDVTVYQWIVLVLGALGFFITWTRQTVNVTRAVEDIKADTAARVAKLEKDLLEKLAVDTGKAATLLQDLERHFDEDQRTQDDRYSELVAAVRQYIANVEKEMHQIEIWGRDNFVLKKDFMDSIGRIEKAIETMANNIRTDVKALDEKIGKIQENQ